MLLCLRLTSTFLCVLLRSCCRRDTCTDIADGCAPPLVLVLVEGDRERLASPTRRRNGDPDWDRLRASLTARDTTASLTSACVGVPIRGGLPRDRVRGDGRGDSFDGAAITDISLAVDVVCQELRRGVFLPILTMTQCTVEARPTTLVRVCRSHCQSIWQLIRGGPQPTENLVTGTEESAETKTKKKHRNQHKRNTHATESKPKPNHSPAIHGRVVGHA